MGLQQDTVLIIADDIGKELVMVADRGQTLTNAFLLTVQDIDHRQGQDALRGFLQGCIENLFDLGPGDQRRDAGSRDPKDSQHAAQPQAQPALKTARPPHPRPNR